MAPSNKWWSQDSHPMSEQSGMPWSSWREGGLNKPRNCSCLNRWGVKVFWRIEISCLKGSVCGDCRLHYGTLCEVVWNYHLFSSLFIYLLQSLFLIKFRGRYQYWNEWNDFTFLFVHHPLFLASAIDWGLILAMADVDVPRWCQSLN